MKTLQISAAILIWSRFLGCLPDWVEPQCANLIGLLVILSLFYANWLVGVCLLRRILKDVDDFKN